MIESLDTWWGGLPLDSKFFYGIGICATAFLGILTAMTLLGLDGADTDGALDPVEDLDHGDIGFLSVRTVIAFLIGFGWTGALITKTGAPIWLALPAGIAAGAVLMYLIFWIMRVLSSLRESGNLDYHNAVGEIGSVYLPIPGERAGRGQVEVMMQGRLQTVPAVTSRPGKLANRTRVLIVDVLEDNTLVVVPDDTPTQT